MSARKSISWVLCVVLVAGFSGVWKLQHKIDAQRVALHQEQDDLVLRSGAMLKVMSLEYAPLMAYRFGSTFLSEPPPRGAGRPDLAVTLMQRGIAANPDYWRLYEDLGFIYYFGLKDYPKASAAFLEGSKNPAARVWMKALAARVLETGETRETSAFLWNEIYNSTTDVDVKKNALTHLQLLRAQTDCEQLDAIAAEYEKRSGRRVARLRDLINAGLVA